MISRPTPLVRLVATHLMALLIALPAATAYYHHKRTSTAALLNDMTRYPLYEAAKLAFRFGSTPQALTLYSALQKLPPTDPFPFEEDMNTELHLAVLMGELDHSAKTSPHLQLAAAACKRSSLYTKCDETSLKKLARRCEAQRHSKLTASNPDGEL